MKKFLFIYYGLPTTISPLIGDFFEVLSLAGSNFPLEALNNMVLQKVAG